MKTLIISLGVVALLIVGFFALNAYIYNEKQAETAPDHRDATFLVEGARITLNDGLAETPAGPGSASQVVTRYFGNELWTDLNGDGKDDAVFLITQASGGTGTFYYVVAALASETGFVGSEAMFIGDRISPQSVHLSTKPEHRQVIVVAYADRLPGEPMSASPSVSKSMLLKLDPKTLQFGEVAQNFEGEAAPSRMSLDMKKWVWRSALYNDGRAIQPKKTGAFTITFDGEGRFTATTDCNSMSGTVIADATTIAFGDIVSTKKYCEGSEEEIFATLLRDTSGYHFTSDGKLILDLKFDSGSVTLN